MTADAATRPTVPQQRATGGPPACPQCGEPALALVDDVDGRPVVVEAADDRGAWLAVRVGTQWRIRRLDPGEQGTADPRLRRRVHRCIYRYPCLGQAGHCPRPGRLYTSGAWCDTCKQRRKHSEMRPTG